MAKVGIVMGSDSDMPIMAKAAEVLEQLGIDYEMTIISAHRQEALRSSLREPERQHIFRACAQHFSQCRSLVSQ